MKDKPPAQTLKPQGIESEEAVMNNPPLRTLPLPPIFQPKHTYKNIRHKRGRR